MPEQLAKAEIRALAAKACAFLPGFRLEADTTEAYGATLRHSDGRGVFIHAPSYPHNLKGKLSLSGCLTNAQYQAKRYDESNVTIYVTAARGAKVLASEIQRRLLPDYTALWTRLVEAVADKSKHDTLTRTNIAALAKIFGVALPRENDSELLHIGLTGREYYGDVRVSGDSVEMKLRSLTIQQAVAVAELLMKKRA